MIQHGASVAIAHLIEWEVDANLATWRLSYDDQMGMDIDAGSTFHTDHMTDIADYRTAIIGRQTFPMPIARRLCSSACYPRY